MTGELLDWLRVLARADATADAEQHIIGIAEFAVVL